MNQTELRHLLLSSLLLTLFITGCNRAAQVEISVRDKLVTFVTDFTNAEVEVTLD
jgi:hypothetical protein